MNDTALLNQLRATVSRLAAPASAQTEYLRSIGTHPSVDELALEFHDLAISPSRLRSQCAISDEAIELITALGAKLSSFSGASNSDEWDVTALEHSVKWAEVRALAKEVVDALD